MVHSIRRSCLKVIQLGLVLVLVVTIVVNVTFLLEIQERRSSEASILRSGKISDGVVEMESTKAVRVVVVSSKEVVSVNVDDKTVLHKDGADQNRGIHVTVLHQTTLRLMAWRVFDTYLPREDESMILFVNSVSNGRIFIFSIKDEGTFNLNTTARRLLTDMGSEYATSVKWRDMWVFVTQKSDGGGTKISEDYSTSSSLSTWGAPVTVVAHVIPTLQRVKECPWLRDADALSQRRRDFCDKYEGYGKLCHCTDPAPLSFSQTNVVFENILHVPVAVIASNRPHYLFRSLGTLLSIPGARVDKVVVFIDGFHEEAMDVTRLFGVRGIFHTPLGVKNARISQHYKSSITATFTLYPKADYMIILEEDLQVSPDFFNYFDQLLTLMDNDPSVYCISAWNDQGYKHSSNDPSLLYRVETMPGLGWMLKKSLYRTELEPIWPSAEKQWDWDMWMRSNGIRKNRECIIPDISRTYHFGKSGLNIFPLFQEVYFKEHAFMTLPYVKLKNVDTLHKDKYETVILELLQHSVPLNHSKSPCDVDFIPSTANKTYVMYIAMATLTDYTSWMPIAKCFHIWDLDARGFHKGLWRLFLRKNHILVVGVPASPYSKYRDSRVRPISMTTVAPSPVIKT